MGKATRAMLKELRHHLQGSLGRRVVHVTSNLDVQEQGECYLCKAKNISNQVVEFNSASGNYRIRVPICWDRQACQFRTAVRDA